MAGKLRRPSPALVVACVALAVALGGTGYAAFKLPKNSVGTIHLKRNAVVSAKVKDGSLLAADFKAGELSAGAQGPKGDKGDAGPSNAYARVIQGDVAVPGALATLGRLTVPGPGKYVAWAKATMTTLDNVASVACGFGPPTADGDRLEAGGSKLVPFSITAIDVREFDASGRFDLRCRSSAGHVTARDLVITAIKVGDLDKS